jgi:hypothetical protein
VLKPIRRQVIVAVGVVAIGVLAVACSGGATIAPGPGGTTTFAGFSFQVPTVTLPLAGPALTRPAMATTQTQAQEQVQGVTHSGAGCPLSLSGQ